MWLVILKVLLCVLGFIGGGSAVEISTRREGLDIWLDLQLIISFSLLLTAAFI